MGISVEDLMQLVHTFVAVLLTPVQVATVGEGAAQTNGGEKTKRQKDIKTCSNGKCWRERCSNKQGALSLQPSFPS